ncbi:MAG: hypothetical protein D3923_18520, partial [Candidatus Electrothrix sp. AR3]|nr:hypothetical protein [Candidatus Electrothrix sp. AR3]
AYRADQFSPDRALVRWLAERGKIHFADIFTDRVREKAAEILIKDRYQASQYGMIRPGQAEYLDLLQALQEMAGPTTGNEQAQLALLEKISPYALVKSPLE